MITRFKLSDGIEYQIDPFNWADFLEVKSILIGMIDDNDSLCKFTSESVKRIFSFPNLKIVSPHEGVPLLPLNEAYVSKLPPKTIEEFLQKILDHVVAVYSNDSTDEKKNQ